MPDKERVSVRDYLEARLEVEEERTTRQLEHALDKVKSEVHETRAWILLLTAASWGNLAANESLSRPDSVQVAGAGVTLLIVIAASVYMFRQRRLHNHIEKLREEGDELEVANGKNGHALHGEPDDVA